ncbi:unnamed protein product, partial [Rotaria socialis]
VFLNKSIDIELNDVSFGFDVENSTSDKPKTPTPSPVPDEKEHQVESNDNSSFTPVNDPSVNSKPSSRRSNQQHRNNRGLL